MIVQPSIFAFASFLLFSAKHPPGGADWPGWRGPGENGVAAAGVEPVLEWSEEKNVRWKVALPGLGNSSPIVVGERIYLTTAIDVSELQPDEAAPPQPGPPEALKLHRFVVLALDRQTGATVWQSVVHEGEPHEKGHVTASHASPSLRVQGERLVASFGSNGLYVLDLSGKLLWQKDFGDMRTLVAFGEGSTPAVHGDTIVMQWDEEGPSFVAALDLNTGEERWRQARDTDSSWGSPYVVEVEGKAQVVLTGSGKTCAYDLKSGELVWSCGGMSKNPVTSAVAADGLLFVMNSYEGNIIQAIELAAARGEVTPDSGLIWTRDRDAAYVPTPLVHEGLLYFVSDSRGAFCCLEATSGKAHYIGERLTGARTVHSSPILAAGRIYISSREGTTVVVRAGQKFEILATNVLDDVFDATPAIVGKEIFLRGRSNLYCLAQDG